MACDKTNLVHAYHDGELPDDQRAAMEEHLRVCEQCRELLAQLRGLTALFTSAQLPSLPVGAVDRIEHAYEVSQDRAILRISSWMTAAAAAVLVGAIVFVPKEMRANEPERPDPVLQELAVMTPVEHRDSARAESVAVAQFFVDELSNNRGERQ